MLFHCTLVMSLESLMPVISGNRLGAGGGGLAYMHMMVGLGPLLVSIALAPVRGEGLRGRLFLLAAVVSSLGTSPIGGSIVAGAHTHVSEGVLTCQFQRQQSGRG